jgi:hypothetical protein
MWNPTNNEWQREGNGYPGSVLLMPPHSTKRRNVEGGRAEKPGGAGVKKLDAISINR